MSEGDVGTRDAGADILHPYPAPTGECGFPPDTLGAERRQWTVVGATREDSNPTCAYGANWIGIEVNAPHSAPLSSAIVPEVTPGSSVVWSNQGQLARIGQPIWWASPLNSGIFLTRLATGDVKIGLPAL